MRITNVLRNMFLVLATEVLLLSGCGFTQPLVPGAAQSLSPGSSQDQVQGESFKAYKVQVVHVFCAGINDAYAKFTATGRATGPFPGKFTANGVWQRSTLFRHNGWSLNESFTITSGVNTVVGSITGSGGTPPNRITCRQFGATSVLQYTSNDGSGAASTTGIAQGVLGESLL
jgi:hypothetical protein